MKDRRALRRRCGYSQARVARLARCCATSVRIYELSESAVRPKLRERLRCVYRRFGG